VPSLKAPPQNGEEEEEEEEEDDDDDKGVKEADDLIPSSLSNI